MDMPAETAFQQSNHALKHMSIAMRLSLGAGFLMLLIKVYAYWITGSAAILSDAAESVVHVLAVSFAAVGPMVSMARNPELGATAIFGATLTAGLISILFAPLAGRLCGISRRSWPGS